MEQTCLVIPLLPDARDDARAWLRALGGARAGELARSEGRLGIARQAWFAAGEGNDLLIGMIETRDFERAMSLLAVSMDPFDLWFKRSLGRLTGLDLNDPPAADLAGLLAGYAAETAATPIMAPAGSAA
jgi:hypothetical protein